MGWLAVNVMPAERGDDLALWFLGRRVEFERKLQNSVDRIMKTRETENRRSDENARRHEWWGCISGVGHGSSSLGLFRCDCGPDDIDKERRPSRMTY